MAPQQRDLNPLQVWLAFLKPGRSEGGAELCLSEKIGIPFTFF